MGASQSSNSGKKQAPRSAKEIEGERLMKQGQLKLSKAAAVAANAALNKEKSKLRQAKVNLERKFEKQISAIDIKQQELEATRKKINNNYSQTKNNKNPNNRKNNTSN